MGPLFIFELVCLYDFFWTLLTQTILPIFPVEPPTAAWRGSFLFSAAGLLLGLTHVGVKTITKFSLGPTLAAWRASDSIVLQKSTRPFFLTHLLEPSKNIKHLVCLGVNGHRSWIILRPVCSLQQCLERAFTKLWQANPRHQFTPSWTITFCVFMVFWLCNHLPDASE